MLRATQPLQMRALVCVKRVIDYAVKVRVSKDKSGVDIKNVKMSMNPFCEIAVEEGIRMKEKGLISELIAVSIGQEKSQEVLRQSLAMGADRAVLITTDMRTDQELQPLAVAKLLQKVVEKEDPSIVLCGKQSIDSDSNQMGQILAGLLGWPQSTFTSALTANDAKDGLTVEREVDSGIQTMKLSLPAVVTTDLRLNDPRYATLPNLMKAKKKPLEKLEATSFGIDLTPRTKIISVEEPPVRAAGVKVADVDELIDKLKNEAKAI
mmetsp:Transcript_21546/g.54325  ORF Transcript_21546/g.54325 Transcript_21546/m.54325 type:complete len:265 (-) Transcript_21546:211-1005(-)|eukprot:g684.t1